MSIPSNPNPIDFSWSAGERLRISLEQITTENAELEPCFIASFLVDHAAQEKLNRELQKGRAIDEVLGELHREFPPSYDRIEFGIGGYPTGQRPKEWRRALFGFTVSISPSCIELLAGRKLDIDKEGHMVALPPPPAKLAEEALNKP